MKRFAATERFDKEWFQRLPCRLKCLWEYICAKCDAAGVWEANFGLASYQIGEPVSEADLMAFGDRVEKLGTDKFWITGFISFQYGQLSEKCKAHIPVFKALSRHKLMHRVSDTLSDRVQEEETEKEKEEDRKFPEEGSGEKHNFPVECQMPSEAEAVAQAEIAGVPKEFALAVWTERMGKAGLDGSGRPITRKTWPFYVKDRYNKRENEEGKAKAHGGAVRSPDTVGSLKIQLEAIQKQMKSLTEERYVDLEWKRAVKRGKETEYNDLRKKKAEIERKIAAA